jgi:hypothetical protein
MATVSQHEQIDVRVEGRPLNAEEEMYMAWGRDSVKLNLALVRDLLGRMLTLASALAGGSAALLKDAVATGFQIGAFLAFLLALIFALFGILPMRENVENNPVAIKASKVNMLEWKHMWLWLSALSLGAGFVVIVVGMFVRAVRG